MAANSAATTRVRSTTRARRLLVPRASTDEALVRMAGATMAVSTAKGLPAPLVVYCTATLYPRLARSARFFDYAPASGVEAGFRSVPYSAISDHVNVSYADGARFHFHPSLWLSKSHDLLVPQRDHWIDAHSAPRGNVTRGPSDRCKQDGHTDKRQRVVWRDLVEHCRKRSSCPQRPEHSHRDADQRQLQSLADEQAHHLQRS